MSLLGNSILTLTPIMSCASTFTMAYISTLFLTQALILGPSDIYTNVNLQKAIKLALKLFVKGQKYNQANPTSWNKTFKIWNPNFYYESLQIESYYFCW